MFNLSTSFILAAVSILGCATVTSAYAVPSTPLDARAEDALLTFKVCSNYNFDGICFNIPVSGKCINLNSGPYKSLHQAISSASVPGGVVCTFFKNSDCHSTTNGNDIAILNGNAGGSSFSNFSQVPGRHGIVDFNDKTSSLRCSSRRA